MKNKVIFNITLIIFIFLCNTFSITLNFENNIEDLSIDNNKEKFNPEINQEKQNNLLEIQESSYKSINYKKNQKTNLESVTFYESVSERLEETDFEKSSGFKKYSNPSIKAVNTGNTWDGNISPVVNPGDWTQINFTATFTAPPTVLVTISDTADNVLDIKAGYHIKDKTTNSFMVFAKESGNISWVAYGPGSGGYNNYEHGIIDVSGAQWTDVAFSSNWNELGAVVISQETLVEDLRSASIKEVNNNNFKVLSKYSLKIHWIAVGDGTGGSNDTIVSKVRENFPKSSWNNIDFGGYFSSLPTVINSQENLGSIGDVRDSPIYSITDSNFSSFARTAVNDMNWIAVGGDTESPTLESYGLEDWGTGFARFWVNASDSISAVDSVILNLNGSEISMNLNGTEYWIYEPSIEFNDYYTYQIVNITDKAGNNLINATNLENTTFNFDIVNPEIIDFIYEPDVITNGTFVAVVTDDWGFINNVSVVLNPCDNCLGSNIAFMEFNGTPDTFVTHSIQIKRGSFSYYVFGYDKAGNLFNSSVHPAFLSNNAPFATNLTLLPQNIRSNEELSISYNFTDLDGDSEGGSQIRWYKNDSLMVNYNNSFIIPASELVKNDIWHATVQPKDGQSFGYVVNSTPIAIGNALPIPLNIEISPSVAFNDSDLSVSYLFTDKDNDSENFSNRSIFWYKNGILELDLNNTLIVFKDNTTKGEIWYFSLQVNDGSEFSLIYNSQNITVQNSKPIVLDPKFNLTTINDNDDFNITYNYFDSDNDPENTSLRKIYWFPNGFHNPSFDDFVNIDSASTGEGDFWYYIIQVNDGFNQSNNFTSIAIGIGTTLNVNGPEVVNLTLLGGTNPLSEDDLIVVYNYTDPENNPQAGSEIWWYKNFELQDVYNGSFILPSSATMRGDQWYYSIRPKDGLNFGNVTPSNFFTILNTKPEVSLTDLLPANPFASSNLQINYQYFDIDSDTITDLYIKWYNNSGEVSILENSTSVDSFHLFKNQTWYYNISIFDGFNWSDWTLSQNVTIKNSFPVIQNVQLTGGTGTDIDIVLFYDFIDIDIDVNNSNIIWYVNSINVQQGIFTVLSSSNFIAGDRVHVAIIPNDGEDNGTLYSSDVLPVGIGVIIIENTKPEIIGIPNIFDQNSQNISFYTNSTLFVRYNASDLDGDLDGNFLYDIELDTDGLVFAARYKWYKNGELTNLTNSNVPSEFLIKGDIWIASVSPRDRYGDFGAWVNATPIMIINLQPEIANFQWIILEPTAQDDLIFDYDFSDLDLDIEKTENLSVHWYFLNGTEILSGQNQTFLSFIALKKGLTIYVEFQVFDGSNYSSLYSSSNLLIYNSIPVVTLVKITPGYSFSGDNLSLVWEHFDYDNDTEIKSEMIISWFRNNQLVSKYSNQTEVNSIDTQSGQFWWVIVLVFDGTNYSIFNQSLTIEILSANLQFIGAQYDDFFLENEDINIEFTYSNPYLESIKTQSLILWYVNDQYQSDYDNLISIPSDSTNPGEYWYFVIIPFNSESYGAVIASGSRLIESVPDFNDFGIEYQTDLEGHYIIWTNVTDSRREINSLTVILTFSNSDQVFLPSTNNGTHWVLNYQLNNFTLLNTVSIITLEATTRIIIFTNPEFVSVQDSFIFNLTDNAPPRVTTSLEFDDNQNPTEITFDVTVEEFGAGVERITLFYYFKPVDGSKPATSFYKIVQNINDIEKFQSIDLVLVGGFDYSITLAFDHQNRDIQILYFIDVEDKSGNRDSFADIEKGLNPNRAELGTFFYIQSGLPFEVILIAILIMAFILGIFSFIVIKKFRKTELVGLDRELVLSKINQVKDEDIIESLDLTTLGIIISLFHQQKGPYPIITVPEMLNDNLELLIKISDLSFSTARFAKDFSSRVKSNFNIDITDSETLEVLSFTFALDRPEARGGAENLSLNFIIYTKYFSFVNQFIEEIILRVEFVHKILNEGRESREIIVNKLVEARKFITSLILSYELIYGSLDQYEEEKD